ncbi:putative zinc-binding metallopeptidase [Skermania piniformis]|uniref:Zinc-binding metallopeptidase n=1 Tax=Skermania pinensis TaxID=39122 RepID=A0ABX8SCM1_9ACTN|nr:putative zinc-binding metallopeptidase [Skermania piniformis]QXQ15608.1 putative zinc-binding metallopeptidase [Skermania piniformis]
MRNFFCPNCGQRLAFKNSVCLSCGTALGFKLSECALIALNDPQNHADYCLCENLHTAECNWVVDAATGGMCESCRLTRTRPADSDTTAMAEFADAEMAKRRLILELAELGLPIVGRDRDPETGLAFDLLGSGQENVMTGHQNGVITLDLAEGDDVHRERLRIAMDEPYRTLLGHLRHEIGHYYFTKLVTSDAELARFRALFGDPDADYQEALDRHYQDGPPPGWESEYVSSYATMHPAEDWAETFAHYLHIRDTADTAAEFGFAPAGATFERTRGRLGPAAFDALIELWLPLSWALNMLNQSMGHPDMYPFVLPEPVLAKMRFVHDICVSSRSAGSQPLPA